MGVINATCDTEAQAGIALKKGAEGPSPLTQRAEGGFLVPHLPLPQRAVPQASEGAKAGRGSSVSKPAASQPVLTVLA